jgi:hypothetical protein
MVSRPSNITALRKLKLVEGSGRRYMETFCGDPCNAHPYGSWTAVTVNSALGGIGTATRISPLPSRRLCP